MPNRSSNVNLSKSTLKELLKSNIDQDFNQTATKDSEANETLREIHKTLKTIKEQNDEIVGDEF